MVHAGVYAALLHYFKAVEALKSDDGTKVIAKRRKTQPTTRCSARGTIRVDAATILPANAGRVEAAVRTMGILSRFRSAILPDQIRRRCDLRPSTRIVPLPNSGRRLVAFICGDHLGAVVALQRFDRLEVCRSAA